MTATEVDNYVFESFVNSDRCKAQTQVILTIPMFESFVNSDRCKAPEPSEYLQYKFESFVNSDRCKAVYKWS